MADILHLARLPVYPPTNGREKRIWKTAQKLAEFGTVHLATPGTRDEPQRRSIQTVDLSNPLLASKAGCIYLWNAALLLGTANPYDRLQARLTQFELGADTAFDLVVCESPQMFRAGHRIATRDGGALLINKHNASYEILQQFLDSTPLPGPIAGRAVRTHRAYEQRAIDAADAVVFQSADDRQQFDYPEETRVETIPNGTDIESEVSAAAVDELRETFGIDRDSFVGVFVGSYDYGPNRNAAQVIDREIAPAVPDVEFLLVGRNPPPPSADTVTAAGFVDNLSAALSLADVALCPLQEGSGTKLKMMDYLAAGLPIVTTSVGASGIDLTDGETALVRETPPEFVTAVRRLAESSELRARLSRGAAELGEAYRWEQLLTDYDELVTELLEMSESAGS